MVIIATLIALFVVFFFFKRHSGPAHLAMIAGLSVYEMFGVQFASWIHKFFAQVPIDLIQTIIYLALILVFPILLYLRSRRGGLSGIMRIIEAALFSVIMATLLSATLAKYMPFDGLAVKISSFISTIEGPIVLVGVISAYIDIMFYRGNN